MNMLAKFSTVESPPETLEALLVYLTRFGKPRIAHTGNGWYSCCEMHVSAKGTTFDVKSEFGMATPMDAAKQCAERVIQTLRDLGAA